MHNVRPPGKTLCWGFPHHVTGGAQTNPEPDAETDAYFPLFDFPTKKKDYVRFGTVYFHAYLHREC